MDAHVLTGQHIRGNVFSRNIDIFAPVVNLPEPCIPAQPLSSHPLRTKHRLIQPQSHIMHLQVRFKRIVQRLSCVVVVAKNSISAINIAQPAKNVVGRIIKPRRL